MKRSRPTTSSAQPHRSSSRGYCWPLLMFLLSGASAFSLNMEYKPPVKSSVKKLYDQRRPRVVEDSSSKGNPGNKRRSFAKAAFAGTLSAPPTIPVVPESFERRMRKLVTGGKDMMSSKQKRPAARQLPENVVTLKTLKEFKETVADEKEKVVAVRFYAPWCKACKAVAPHFYRMAVQNPDTIFVDVPVSNDNAALHQGLGVPSLPFGHIYHPTGGLVEELRLTRKLVPEFHRVLQSYQSGSCDLAHAPSE